MRDFLFVHIPKTGGRSVYDALKSSNSDYYFIGSDSHCSIQDYIELYGADYVDNAFKFTIVRNPWDRAWSYFKFFILGKKIDVEKYFYNFDQWIIDNVPYLNTDYFPATGKPWSKKDRWAGKGVTHTFKDIDFLTDAYGVLKVDYFLKFENIQNDFNN